MSRVLLLAFAFLREHPVRFLVTALATIAAGMGLMVITMGPLSRPAVLQATEVTYMGTFTPISICLTGRPASRRAPSKVKEHPMRKETRPSLHRVLMSVGSSVRTPSR